MHKTLRMLDNTMDIIPGQLPRSLERGRGSSGFRRQRTWQSTIGSGAGSTCMYRGNILPSRNQMIVWCGIHTWSIWRTSRWRSPWRHRLRTCWGIRMKRMVNISHSINFSTLFLTCLRLSGALQTWRPCRSSRASRPPGGSIGSTASRTCRPGRKK